MQVEIEKIQLKDINVVKIDVPSTVWLSMHRLIDVLSDRRNLDDVLTCSPCRAIKIKGHVFLFERYFFWSVLAERYPNLEIEFLTVTLKRNETLASIRERILRQIQLESLTSLDPLHTFSFEKANSSKRLLRRKDYAQVLGRKPNTLNVYDRLFEDRRTQTNPEVNIEPLNPEEILNQHRVSPLPTDLKQDSSDEA